ncbi:MAG TPA: hypothetical protein VIY48_08130 [Candidatus Paceibacterota bacterium]
MKRTETADETIRHESPAVYDKHGEPWTGNAAGWTCIVFVALIILTALVSLLASVLHGG